MTIIAKRGVQLNGHIYSKGEAAEWNGRIDKRIADLFTAKDGSALSVTVDAPPPPPPPPPPPASDAGTDTPQGPTGPKGTPGDIGAPAGDQPPPAGDQPPPPPADNAESKEPEAAATTAERIQKLVSTLGRKGIEQKLDELKVSFSSKANTEALAKLLLQQQGEIDA